MKKTVPSEQWRNAMRAFGAQAPPVFLKKENSILFNE